MRVAVVGLVFLFGCHESQGRRAGAHEIDPYVGREVPLEYRKVFRQPKLADLRADGADDATIRVRWAEAMTRLGSVAMLEAQGSTLVVTYSPSAHDRICDADNWARLYDLPTLGFSSVRCADGSEAAVVDDRGKAKRQRIVERAEEIVAHQDVALVWHESEGMVITAVVQKGKCNRSRLAKLAAKIKKAGIDLRGAGFSKIECSVDSGELQL